VSWLPAQAPDARTALDAVFGLRPNLYAAYRDFCALFWERPLLDPVVLELCRLRVAQLLECRGELALRYRGAREAGLDEERIGALERWADDPRFSPLERACLAIAEKFTLDPHAISDAEAAAVVAAVGEKGMVALVEALAVFDGLARLRNALGVEPVGADARVVEAPRRGADSME
jgi:AhpD family alkylhydroperoxidase